MQQNPEILFVREKSKRCDIQNSNVNTCLQQIVYVIFMMYHKFLLNMSLSSQVMQRRICNISGIKGFVSNSESQFSFFFFFSFLNFTFSCCILIFVLIHQRCHQAPMYQLSLQCLITRPSSEIEISISWQSENRSKPLRGSALNVCASQLLLQAFIDLQYSVKLSLPGF